MKKGLVSIIVPVYNAEEFIIETIDSIKAQTYKNWELLLVDDISLDNSVNLINKYIDNNKELNIKLIKLSEKGFAAVARNTGIDYSNGEYICFLDADDIWDCNKLKIQVEFMKESDCEFSFHSYEFADENANGLGKVVNVPSTITYKQALRNTTIWTSTVMFNMNKLSKELVHMPIVASEDTACWWKILKTIKCAYGISDNLALYRRSNGTLSSNKFSAIKRIWHLYRKVEKLNIFYSIFNFIFYSFNAVRRRI